MRWIHCMLLITSLACASGAPPARSASASPEPTTGDSDSTEPERRTETTEADPPERTWAIVPVTLPIDAGTEDLANSIEDRCPQLDFECAAEVAGSRERACAALGCRSWQLQAASGSQSTVPIELAPPLPLLDTRRASELEIRDIDGDGRLEALATFGVHVADIDGLWTIRLTRIVDLETGATQGLFLRRSENDTFAEEGQSSRFHVTDQTWRIEGTELHLHRVVGEGMCDSGRDGPPVAREDDFDPCEVSTRDRICVRRPDTDDYQCRSSPLALPPWLAAKLVWRSAP